MYVETDTDFDIKRKICKYIGLPKMQRGNIATRRQRRRAQISSYCVEWAEKGGEGGQRYSAADRNIRRYLRMLGVRWQDIGTGEPTTPRYIEGTKHRGSGRRTRIEILFEYSCVFLRVSDFYGTVESRGLHVGNRMDLRAVGRLPWLPEQNLTPFSATDKSKIWHEKDSAMKDDSQGKTSRAVRADRQQTRGSLLSEKKGRKEKKEMSAERANSPLFSARQR